MKLSGLFKALVLISMSFTFSACGKTHPSAKLNGNAREALIKALKAKLHAKSYRMKVVQSSTVGLSSTQEAEYVAPDKYHIFSEMNMGGQGKGKQEIIVLGQEAYMKGPEGKWKKTQLDPQKIEATRLRDQMLIDNLSKAKDADIEFSGEEHDGEQAFIYHQSITASGTPSRSQTITWVGVTDGLPHKVEIEVETKFEGRPMSIKTTTTYYDYNADILINAPM